MKERHMGFLSYASFDDQHDGGYLSALGTLLGGEIQEQTGQELPIFQDRKDIRWGQNWRERIEASLDSVVFLFPVLTPSFFSSEECRSEVKRFLEKEKKLLRSDLILPIYYVTCPVLHDEGKRAKDEVAQIIAMRQWADWRELRFERLESPEA